MNSQYSLAVLMPVFNAEKYLKDSINSILEQSYEEFHLYIIDDNSHDQSWKIINSYNDKRIKIYRNNRNQGVAYSLNYLLSKTINTYRYIARMDADDYSYPERFKSQINFLDTNLNIDICGTQGFWLRNFDGYTSKSVWKYPCSHAEIMLSLLFSASFGHSSIVFRSNSLNRIQVKYDESLVSVEDWELWTRLVFKLEMANLQDFLMKYRITENSNHRNPRNKDVYWEQLSYVLSDYWSCFGIEIDRTVWIKFIRQTKTSFSEFGQIIIAIRKLQESSHIKEFKDSILFSKFLSVRLTSYISKQSFPYNLFMFYQIFFEDVGISRRMLFRNAVKRYFRLLN